MSQGRIAWMDLVRGLAILLVVLMHATDIPSASAPTWLQQFNHALEPFRMPVLMFLSGLLLGRGLDRPGKAYFEGKLAAVLWPFLIWTFWYLSRRDVLHTPVIALKMLLLAPDYMWFLQALFLFYVAAWLLDRARIPFAPVAAASLVLACAIPETARLARMTFLFPFFLCGHLAALRGDMRLAVPNSLALLLFVAAIAIASGLSGGRLDPAVRAVGITSLALVLIGNGQAIPSGGWREPFEWIGRNSIVFYVAHKPMLHIVASAVEAMGAAGFWSVFLPSLTAAMLFGVALAYGRPRLPLVAALFDLRALRPTAARSTAG